MKTPENISEIEVNEKTGLAPLQKLAIHFLAMIVLQGLLYLIPFADNGRVKMVLISFIILLPLYIAPYLYFHNAIEYGEDSRKKSAAVELVGLAGFLVVITLIFVRWNWLYLIWAVSAFIVNLYYQPKYIPSYKSKMNIARFLDERDRMINGKALKNTAVAVRVAGSIFIFGLVDHYGMYNLMPVGVLLYSVPVVINVVLIAYSVSILVLYKKDIGYEES